MIDRDATGQWNQNATGQRYRDGQGSDRDKGDVMERADGHDSDDRHGNTTMSWMNDNGGDDGDGPRPGAGDGLRPDELALRRLLHSAVDEIEPSDHALDQLRRAIPARRARKRQALVGMAAAVVLAGTCVPAVVHISAATSGASSETAASGNSDPDAQGGADGKRSDESGAVGPGPSPSASGKDRKGGEKDGRPPAGVLPGTGSGQPGVVRNNAPLCHASQLGDATATVSAPAADGTVYGTFRIANVSAGDCTVSGSGSVFATAQGGAGRGPVPVVDHVPGDAAPGLPAPSAALTALVLQPGTAYEVRFAWVPAESCGTPGGNGGGGEPTPGPSTDPTTGPTTGPSPDPSPDPAPDPTPTTDPTPQATDGPGSEQAVLPDPGTATGGGTAGGGAEDGPTTQLAGVRQIALAEGPGDGGVTVSHTAEQGAPSASTTIPGACAGTVYRTGVLPAGS